MTPTGPRVAREPVTEMTDLERRRANGWLDGEPDRICMHGVNVTIEGTCDACMERLTELLRRASPKPRIGTWTADRSAYDRGYDAGYKTGIRRHNDQEQGR